MYREVESAKAQVGLHAFTWGGGTRRRKPCIPVLNHHDSSFP